MQLLSSRLSNGKPAEKNASNLRWEQLPTVARNGTDVGSQLAVLMHHGDVDYPKETSEDLNSNLRWDGMLPTLL